MASSSIARFCHISRDRSCHITALSQQYCASRRTALRPSSPIAQEAKNFAISGCEIEKVSYSILLPLSGLTTDYSTFYSYEQTSRSRILPMTSRRFKEHHAVFSSVLGHTARQHTLHSQKSHDKQSAVKKISGISSLSHYLCACLQLPSKCIRVARVSEHLSLFPQTSPCRMDRLIGIQSGHAGHSCAGVQFPSVFLYQLQASLVMFPQLLKSFREFTSLKQSSRSYEPKLRVLPLPLRSLELSSCGTCGR